LPKWGVSGVTFDLWETLFIDDPELDRQRDHLRCQGLHKVLGEHGVDVSIADLTRGLDESSTWLVDFWKTGEQVAIPEQIRYIVESATKKRQAIPPKAMKELEEAYASPGLVTPPALNVDTGLVLMNLRARGYKIGLICNTGRGPGRILRQLMASSGILGYFDATVFSDEVGHGKPDRRIFIAAAKELGLPINEILHVGDNPETDVRGAKQAGMKAILFEYAVPSGFRERPASLFARTRSLAKESLEVVPDGRITSLIEVLKYLP
jgi:putative hydrolase of the HAD superfamily